MAAVALSIAAAEPGFSYWKTWVLPLTASHRKKAAPEGTAFPVVFSRTATRPEAESVSLARQSRSYCQPTINF